MRYQAIIFDFDGVLVESNDIKAHAFAELYSDLGDEIVARIVDYHLSFGGLSRFAKLRHFHGTYRGLSLSDQEMQDLADRFSSLVVDKVVQAAWVPGARAFLDAHLGKATMFVASGTPRDELATIVERRGMAHYFTDVFGSPTPKKKNVRDALEKYRLSPGDVLFVGDAPADQEAALANGLDFIGRRSSPHRKFLEGTVCIDDLQGLEDAVKRLAT
jgi:phosphoglycolate phosphatase-like HAD superfamily hydrolase